MTDLRQAASEDILDFWFGELGADGRASPENAKKWWKKDAEFDAHCREHFEQLHKAVMAGSHEDWCDTARGCLAYVIVLDQLSRNMYRGTPGMFASDARAQAAVLAGLAKGFDEALAVDERVFFYMPLMHSEDLSLQNTCVEHFQQMCDALDGDVKEHIGRNAGYAEQHRDIIARFARFPHRNGTLGRTCTPDEEEFLAQPGSSF